MSSTEFAGRAAGAAPVRGIRKLAGTALMHFGAFLDRRWRQNDILWGRLDGAERLIASVTQGSWLSDELRTSILQRAQLAIYEREEPLTHGPLEGAGPRD